MMTTEKTFASTPDVGTPWTPGWLATKAKRSFAFRSGPLYKRALAMLPPPKVNAKPRFDVPLITMCGGKHLPLLVEMLHSISLYWSRLPEVTVINDGSIKQADIERQLAWWPGDLKLTHWKDYQEYHRQRGRAALVEYAEKSPFGRKLSAMLAWSETGQTFWCDCDLLFYTDFVPFLTKPQVSSPFLLATQDWIYAYDEHLLAAGLSYLLDRPQVNSGVCLFEGNLYRDCQLEPLIRLAAVQYNWFTEQTIIAHALYQVGRIEWPLEIIRVFDDDKFSILPTYLHQRWIARHYTNNIRHLFWRDALALRLGIGRPAPTIAA